MAQQQRHSESARVSRREFVKATAAMAAAGAVVNWAHAEGSATIRLGLIGCGSRGTGAAVQALNADPGVALTAMGDMLPDRLTGSLGHLHKHAPQRVQVPPERQYVGFDAYQQVIDSGVDVVILATPPHFRPVHLNAAVDAGKHVFCEKPMAVDATGVRKVLRAAKQAERKRLTLVAGFCWRYSLPERATYGKIHDGAIGEVVSMHTTYHTSPLGTKPRQPGWSDMEWQLRNWPHFIWLSGDHIVEQACHSIDKINWAMGDVPPVRATALGGRLMREGPERGNVYDHFAVIYEYENGTRCFHTCRQMAHCSNDNSDYLLGTQGKCTVNGWTKTHEITGEHPWSYDGEHRSMYQVEHDELFASIRKGKPINDGVWMARSTMMAILGRTAAYTGQTVTWEEALASEEDLSPPTYDMGEMPVRPVPMPGGNTP